MEREREAGPGFVPGRHMLDSYGRGGFRFAGMSHRGSILALPSGVRAWPVESLAELTIEALRPIFDEEPSLELLLLGTGDQPGFVPEAIRRHVRAAGIGLDPMATGPAARTYNVLVAEERRVGAALIAVA